MRLLIFGKTGQVARSLADLCDSKGIDAEFLGRDQADLTDPAACAAAIHESNADIIINAAAYTAVDQAETNQQTAHLVNAISPTEMARAAAKKRVPFLHISTDYVFDGSGTKPWCEDDPVAPQSAYGSTKLAGETGIQAAGGDHVILRTAWVFSAYGANFVKTMCRVGAERDKLSVVDDQRGGPTPAAAIAEALLTIARAFVAGKGTSGIYHLTGSPAVSWADFADAIFDGEDVRPEITRIPTSDYPTPAKRPANSVLDCAKIKRCYGIGQPDWQAGLQDVLQELKAEK